ncbi:MAG: response regulator [Gemmatimonadota bacterium]
MANSAAGTDLGGTAEGFSRGMRSACQPERRSVLLIDDDPSVRTFFRMSLPLFGYQVDTVRSCRDARKKLASRHYSTILLDLVLPDSSGIFFYYRLKARRPELAAKVIFLTGAIERFPRLGALRAEGRPVLLKPTRIREVLNAIRAIE